MKIDSFARAHAFIADLYTRGLLPDEGGWQLAFVASEEQFKQALKDCKALRRYRGTVHGEELTYEVGEEPRRIDYYAATAKIPIFKDEPKPKRRGR